MDWLSFIANIVSSVSWPLSIFFVAALFRSQIRALFSSVKKLKWKDVEAEFGDKVEQIREEVKLFEDDPDYEDSPVEEKLVRLVETHPHLAVLEGWKSLERSISSLSIKRLGTDRSRSTQEHIDAISKSELVPRNMLNAISNIREVRNRAAHELDADVSKGSAYVLLDTIADVTTYLDKLTRKV